MIPLNGHNLVNFPPLPKTKLERYKAIMELISEKDEGLSRQDLIRSDIRSEISDSTVNTYKDELHALKWISDERKYERGKHKNRVRGNYAYYFLTDAGRAALYHMKNNTYPIKIKQRTVGTKGTLKMIEEVRHHQKLLLESFIKYRDSPRPLSITNANSGIIELHAFIQSTGDDYFGDVLCFKKHGMDKQKILDSLLVMKIMYMENSEINCLNAHLREYSDFSLELDNLYSRINDIWSTLSEIKEGFKGNQYIVGLYDIRPKYLIIPPLQYLVYEYMLLDNVSPPLNTDEFENQFPDAFEEFRKIIIPKLDSDPDDEKVKLSKLTDFISDFSMIYGTELKQIIQDIHGIAGPICHIKQFMDDLVLRFEHGTSLPGSCDLCPRE